MERFLQKNMYYGSLIALMLWWCTASAQTFRMESPIATGESDSLASATGTPIKGNEKVLKNYNALAAAYNNSNPDSTFKYAKLALELSQSLSDRKGLADSHRYLGDVFKTNGLYSKAIDQYAKAAEFYEAIDDEIGLGLTHNALGTVYELSSQSELGMEQFRQALIIFESADYASGKALTFGHIGHYYEKSGQYEQALDYQRQALELYQNLNDYDGLSEIYGNIGSIYEDKEAFEQARNYFTQALEFSIRAGNKAQRIIHLNNLGDTYRKISQNLEAISYYSQAYDLAAELHDQYQMQSALRDLAKVYAASGNYAQAHTYLDRAHELYSEMFDQESSRQIAQAQALYGIHEMEKQIDILEKDKAISVANGQLLVAGIISLMLISILIVSFLRLRNKKDRKIMKANEELVKTELKNTQLSEQGLKRKLEIRQLKEQQLKNELDARNQELSTRALHIVQKNKILEELKTQLKQIVTRKSINQQKMLNQVVSKIEYSFKLDEDWEDFSIFFKQVHPEFYMELDKRFPGISPSEKRLCSLLRLNMSSKDIASILGITPDSVRIARYRLRKKLGMEKRDGSGQFYHATLILLLPHLFGLFLFCEAVIMTMLSKG